MAVFPSSPIPSYPLIVEPIWKTYISESEIGDEQRRQKWIFSKFDVTMQFDDIELDEIQNIFKFYQARKGAYEGFYLFDLVSMDWDDLYMGTADGSQAVFDVPGKDISSLQVYLNSTLQTLNVDYTISTGTAEGSADQVTFGSPPPQGYIARCGFIGIIRFRVRFAEDKMSRENFTAMLYQTGVLKFKGLPLVI